ncbi:MAG: phosphoribosylanthranilate isomerase [Methylococcales symbiont of Hymedesmia sp. n. MRB-2018]|nr:MAG: phosphoribosylanthranilate isomerase [Methylococcales symbiont of Hymedesmia sp. n. MRB-2018]KAF3983066.1 MAG: phosphoribosylanthranilate isomerase [Methylococcales symbiont of Hymedesmia sp. n. MRB-2018]
MRTRIKICGFTRVEDAVAAAKLGVDAIGLVFYPPSPRSISIEHARNIVNALPAFVSVVALFVDGQESQIKQVLNKLAIDVIQFHGDEPANQCNIYNKPYLKAIKMTKQMDVLQIAEQYNDASALLLDTYQPGIKGGSGHQFDWDLIPKQCALPIVLAGGLHADNARLAVQSVRPYALDVSSGVETEKGIKDVAKMAAFIQQVKEGDN